MLGVLIPVSDTNTLLKYFRLLFFPIAALFVIQEITYAATGDRFVFHLPISSETAYYGDLSFHQLEILYKYSERSASIFMEPAYLASFLLMHLCLELFSEKEVEKLYTPVSVLIVMILLVLRSGTGLIGLALLGSIKLISYYKRTKSSKIIALMFIILPLLYVGATYYISTEIGESMLKRQTELSNQSGSSYERIFRGIELYGIMPVQNQIYGIDLSVFREGTNYNGVETIDKGMLFNGFMTILVSKGLIGMILLLWVYISIYRNRESGVLTKASLLLLLLLSWIESIYMSPVMLILTIVAYSGCRRSYNNF